jgi:hypothetical protein
MKRLLIAMLVLVSCTDGTDDMDVDAGHDAAPMAVCFDDHHKCDINVLMVCAGGQWVIEEDCTEKEFICEDNLDGLAACTHACDPDTDSVKCYENKVMSCDLSQAWDEEEDCSATGSKCVEEITNGEVVAFCL